MSWEDREDTTIYRAVVNHEEQYSLWPVNRELPLGWTTREKVGRKQEVLDWIAEVWTDMRPLSLRRKMEEEARRREEEAPERRGAGGGSTPGRRAAPMFRAIVDWEEARTPALPPSDPARLARCGMSARGGGDRLDPAKRQ